MGSASGQDSERRRQEENNLLKSFGFSRSAQKAIVNIRRIKFCKCDHRIDRIAPDALPVIGRQCPEMAERGRIRKMRPQTPLRQYPRQRCPRDMLDNRLLLREIKPYRAVKGFQVLVLVQMLNSAADIV